ncbi:MAG: P-type conjugative transfer protein TrbL [Desulfobacter sp.]|nr:MAG: P-type conjugative transfer protein TrbL [Desulfobacter sp.]
MKKTLSVILIIVCCAIVVEIVAPDLASAAPSKNNIIEQILDQFIQASSQWEDEIKTFSSRLFWLLAGVNFAWVATMLVLQNGDIGDFVRELIKFIFFVGFWWWVLCNSGDLTTRIIDSFRQIGASTYGGVKGISPSNILETCYNIFITATKKIEVFEGETWMIGIGALGVLAFGVLIAAQLTLSIVKAYVAIAIGTVALGFGGSKWTEDISKNYLKMVVATGMELMAIQMLVGLSLNLFKIWSNIPSEQFGVQTTFSLLIGLAFLFVIMKEIPSMISGIVFGMQFGGGGIDIVAKGVSTGIAVASATLGAGALAAKAGAIAATARGMQGGAMSNIAGAAYQTMKDNVGQPAAMKRSMMGGTMSNLMSMKQEQSQPGGEGGGGQTRSPSQEFNNMPHAGSSSLNNIPGAK